MKAITPSSPLLTLIVEAANDYSIQHILEQFHPIMKSFGFGHFENEQPNFYQASKGGDGIFSNELFVFAEADDSSVVINMDGHSIFGLKGVEEQLKLIKERYDSLGARATIIGPNYASAFIGNLLYTALPIYTSACILIGMMVAFGNFKRLQILNLLLYATLGIIGAKTRFWVNERRKQRPVWKSILILMLSAPLVLVMILLFFWAIDQLS